ncbi:hypothetical protein [Paraburkholderia acidiphila]|uniref:Uncharacterized protein n=1 Tax=Paraburkholderia acidiphila TaxID=2571747 RepID=A0A7Z2GBY3_9BURK|nr:hypothetical protein [Paraburkholderia acidiphila]QGZ58968.1 hypothetical protein FAZ97_28910 [Paraburkholderia acidiphila]
MLFIEMHLEEKPRKRILHWVFQFARQIINSPEYPSPRLHRQGLPQSIYAMRTP